MKPKLSQAQKKMLDRLRGVKTTRHNGAALMHIEGNHLTEERVLWLDGTHERANLKTVRALLTQNLLTIVSRHDDTRFYTSKELTDRPEAGK